MSDGALHAYINASGSHQEPPSDEIKRLAIAAAHWEPDGNYGLKASVPACLASILEQCGGTTTVHMTHQQVASFKRHHRALSDKITR